MKKTIEIIPQINNQLEQFKSSIGLMIQQNNEYFNSTKQHLNETFDIKINGELTEDGLKTETDNLQKLTDKFIDEINKIYDSKEKEILQN